MTYDFGYLVSLWYPLNDCCKKGQLSKIRLIQTKYYFFIFTKCMLFLGYLDYLSWWALDLIGGPKFTEILLIQEFSITHFDKRLEEELI